MIQSGSASKPPYASVSPVENLCIGALALACILLVALLHLTPLTENDFWTQIKVGEIIRETGSIPDTVLFAVGETADTKFVAYEWLTSVAFSYVHSAFGVEGAIVARGVLALTLFSLFFLLSFQINRDPLLSLFIAMASFLVISCRVLMRPELISYIFGLATLNLLNAFLRTGRRRWLIGLLPLSTLWANCHGSFLVGIAFPLFFLGGGIADDLLARWRGQEIDFRQRVHRVFIPLALTSFAMTLAALVNPFGSHLFEHVVNLSGSEFIRKSIQEWKPAYYYGFRGSTAFYFYLAFAILVFDGFVQKGKGLPIRLFLITGVFLYLSIDANRHVAWFAIGGAYALAYSLGGSLRLQEGRSRNAAWLTVVLLCGAATTFKVGNTVGQSPGFSDRSPLNMEAIEFIRNSGYSGNVFNSYRYGGKLAYHLYPEVRITIDDRIDAYGEDYYSEYQRFEAFRPDILASAEEFVEYFDRRQLNLVVLDMRPMETWHQSGRLQALEAAGWKRAYGNAKTYILRRENTDPVQN